MTFFAKSDGSPSVVRTVRNKALVEADYWGRRGNRSSLMERDGEPRNPEEREKVKVVLDESSSIEDESSPTEDFPSIEMMEVAWSEICDVHKRELFNKGIALPYVDRFVDSGVAVLLALLWHYGSRGLKVDTVLAECVMVHVLGSDVFWIKNISWKKCAEFLRRLGWCVILEEEGQVYLASLDVCEDRKDFSVWKKPDGYVQLSN